MPATTILATRTQTHDELLAEAVEECRLQDASLIDSTFWSDVMGVACEHARDDFGFFGSLKGKTKNNLGGQAVVRIAEYEATRPGDFTTCDNTISACPVGQGAKEYRWDLLTMNQFCPMSGCEVKDANILKQIGQKSGSSSLTDPEVGVKQDIVIDFVGERQRSMGRTNQLTRRKLLRDQIMETEALFNIIQPDGSAVEKKIESLTAKFDLTTATGKTPWDDANADPYGDIDDMLDQICGTVEFVVANKNTIRQMITHDNFLANAKCCATQEELNSISLSRLRTGDIWFGPDSLNLPPFIIDETSWQEDDGTGTDVTKKAFEDGQLLFVTDALDAVEHHKGLNSNTGKDGSPVFGGYAGYEETVKKGITNVDIFYNWDGLDVVVKPNAYTVLKAY